MQIHLMKILTSLLNKPTTFQTVIAALVFITIISSCQKEVTGDLDTPVTTTPTTPSSSAIVKTYTIDVAGPNGSHNITIFNLTHDANNRLTGLISATTVGDKIIYTYNSDNTYTMDIFESNVLSIHELFYLNNIPSIDSTVQYDTPNNDTTTEKYLYNANKQLTILKTYNYSKNTGITLVTTSNYTYDNSGNIIKEVQGSQTTTYQYYPDLFNSLSLGMIYFQQSKNLVKTTTENNGTFNSKIINHTYTFDSNNRITSEKRVFTGGSDTVIQKYTY